MSLPEFDTQGSLFESLGSLAANLFSDQISTSCLPLRFGRYWQRAEKS